MVIKVSKIDELLKNEKVEWKKLGEVCEILDFKRKPITKSKRVFGEYPYYGANGVQDYVNDFIFDGTFILMGEDGSVINQDNTPILHWVQERKIWVNNHAHVLGELDSKYILKYIYYFLTTVDVSSIVKGMPPKINQGNMRNINIPIPSLEAQEKIVETLDKFTNYVNELQTELQARNMQYSYYRDLLLSEEYLNKLSMKFEFTNFQVKCQNLDDITYITSGGDIPKESYSNVRTEKFNIPIISNGVGENAIYGFTDKAKINEDAVTISARGTIGYAQYRNYPFYPVVRLLSLVVKDKSNVNTKYLYYLMQDKKYNLPPTGIPQLTIPMLKKIKVILPSIEIQNKVVEVLDRFEELVENSRGLLPEEIEKRQKQYEYYRKKLLTFDENVVEPNRTELLISNGYFIILREACDIVGVNLFCKLEHELLSDFAKVTKLAGYEFSKYVKYKDEGEIIALRGLNVKKGKIILNDVKYIDESNFSKLKRSKLIKGDILFTYVGTIGEVGLVCDDDKFYLAPNVAMIRINKDYIKPKYLLHLLQSSSFKHKGINKWLESSSMKNLTMENIRKFNIIIPPLQVQDYVISILDKFDKFVNDVNEGLPKEIDLRQKEYEYYREKLLDFPKN